MNRVLVREDFDKLWRCFMSKDSDELLCLLGFIPKQQELLFHFFDDPDACSELLIGSFSGDRLIGFVHGIMRPWKAGSSRMGYIKWLHVNADEPNNKTIGRELLNEIEDRFKKLGFEQIQYGSASPYYLVPSLPEQDIYLRSLLRDDGWNETSDRISLKVNPAECDRDGSLLAQLQTDNPNLQMITLTEPDLQLQTFVAESFSESWAMEVKYGLEHIPVSHCSVLYDAKDDIIGFAAVNAVNRNWFGPMGIKPELRGTGLGKMILLHAMHEATKTGNNSLILSWVNDKADFYRKIFPNAETIIFKKMTKGL